MGIAVEFEERAVAFVDVLGFKSLVEEAVRNDEQLEKLNGLIRLLSSAIIFLDSQVERSVPRHLLPRHLYISDCIILSAPLSDQNHKSYNGLSIIIMRVIQLSHYLLQAGYLIRGGIAVGEVWHTQSNIVGPAYQEALELEKGNAPIVVLSEPAAKLWKGGSRTCLQYNGKVFVNGLFDYYMPNASRHGVIEQQYDDYAVLADRMLNSDLDSSAKEKWSWFREFLRSEAPEGLLWAHAAGIKRRRS